MCACMHAEHTEREFPASAVAAACGGGPAVLPPASFLRDRHACAALEQCVVVVSIR